jgi:hypothetical protein
MLQFILTYSKNNLDNNSKQNIIENETISNEKNSDSDNSKIDKYGLVKKEIEKFKLPITYLESSELFKLSDTVSSDLELIESKDTPSMYEYLFKPQHEFAKTIMPSWKEQYTNNIEYLEDTQHIITNISEYKSKISESKYKPNCEKLFDIWNLVKNDDSFLDKYNYMEWDVLKSLNNSSSFLQLLSMINVVSPLISLSIPFLLILFPFIILKIQGIPITFNTYLEVLKEIARNHFIGRTLTNLQTISIEKVIYIIITFGLYCLQIYQNTTSCLRFYKNVQLINESLLEMRLYTKYSIESMENFLEIIEKKSSYNKFGIVIREHLSSLRNLNSELQFIKPFKFSFNKFSEIGYMLKCFYELYENIEYTDAIRFSMGFEGYISNLIGVNENLVSGTVSFTKYESKVDEKTGGLEFKEQYYPPLINESPVKNNCKFDKNMIISSPNKSGKTTILKTTAINIIFSQQLGCGFYNSGKLTPYTHIHSYLNIPDTSGRDSLFQAESRRCKEIIDIISDKNTDEYRHFCMFDELYSGTNPDEASKSGYAFLKYLSEFSNVNFILTTHYFTICKKLKNSEKIQNYKMDIEILEDGSFKYKYKIKKGISRIKGAIRVLKDMNYPKEIIDMVEMAA